ncbi:hypothetical protein PF003_g11845 [Phytophthora fragariae]|nr:hypothetical protein PF003_g11845 [Phytophthora fragariae]
MTMEGEVTVYAQPGAGYKNWKKATSKDGFRKHVGQNCSKHHSAALEYDNRKTTVQDVALAIEDQSISERLQNRSRIKFILDVCLLLAKQEIAFRGNNEKDNSENKGNFHEFVQFMTDNNNIFPTLYRLICLVCVLPVSTATTERSFSAMKRIKTRLRTTMGDTWMSDLMLLAIERDLTNKVDKDAVIDLFNDITPRRKRF